MNDLLSRYPELEKCKGSIAEALELLLAVYQNHGKVLDLRKWGKRSRQRTYRRGADERLSASAAGDR